MAVRTVICVLFLIVISVQGKVIKEEDLSDVSQNLISRDDKKAVGEPLHIDLPVFKTKIKVDDVTTKPKEDDTLSISKALEDRLLSNHENKIRCSNTTEEDISNNLVDSTESNFCDEQKDTALILTSFLEEGKIEEARNACEVNSTLFLGIKSYSGFFTVNKTYNSNIFFWYIPVENKPINETPWIIWLQGGPGVSSLTGLFDELGPFQVASDGTLKKNPFTWSQNHSLVFIDNPVGTGYSFTDHADGFAQDMATYSAHLYSTVQQFLQIFPELRTAPLYIAGESYAGKYVPSLATVIHKHKDPVEPIVNLQGLILGNAYIDPSMVLQITRAFYYFGLLSKEQLQIVDPLLKSFQQDIAANNSVAAKEKWGHLISILVFLSHQTHIYNFLKDDLPVGHYVTFLKNEEIKKALHVGQIKFSFLNITVNSKTSPDFLSSTKSMIEELLEQYRVLVYCGQLDQMLPCVVSSEHYRTWKWNDSSEFFEASRYPYIFNHKLSGYHKTGGRLTEVVIRGAGHMVPVDQPAPIQNLVARWTHNKPLSRRFGLLEGSYVQEYVKNHSMIYSLM